MKDFLLDENNDILFRNGDLVIGDSDNQHVALLAATSAGQWKQSPSAGMGLNRFLLGELTDVTKMLHIVDVQLKADGVASKTVKFIDGKLQIDAKY